MPVALHSVAWRSLVGVVVAAGLALPAAAAPASTKPVKPPKKPRPPVVAVLPFGGVVDDALRARLAAQVRVLAAPFGFVVDDAARTESLIKDVLALGLSCDDNSIDCMVRVGALGGAQTVLAGVLSPEEGGTRLELVAVDVGAVRERSRVRVRVPADAEREGAALTSALIGTFRPEEWRGQLKVQVAQRGASIVVDGVVRGIAPLSAVIELPPGPHQLFVGLEGFRAHKAVVDVVYDAEAVADVVLVPGESEAAPLFSAAPALAPPTAPPKAPPEAPKGPQRVVFYDVEPTGVLPRTARVLGALLTTELRKREGVSVLDSSELRALVGDGTGPASDLRNCSAEQCFAEVAEALGADSVVVGQLTRVEGTVLFGLRRIDQRKQEVIASFVERAPADDDAALLPLVGKSISTTFGELPLRKGQTAGVDDAALRVLRPPPVAANVTSSVLVAAVGCGVAGVVGLGVVAVALPLQRLAVAERAHNDDIAVRQAFVVGGVIAAVGGAVVGGGLGVAGLALDGFTDWDNNAGRFEAAQ